MNPPTFKQLTVAGLALLLFLALVAIVFLKDDRTSIAAATALTGAFTAVVLLLTNRDTSGTPK